MQCYAMRCTKSALGLLHGSTSEPWCSFRLLAGHRVVTRKCEANRVPPAHNAALLVAPSGQNCKTGALSLKPFTLWVDVPAVTLSTLLGPTLAVEPSGVMLCLLHM